MKHEPETDHQKVVDDLTKKTLVEELGAIIAALEVVFGKLSIRYAGMQVYPTREGVVEELRPFASHASAPRLSADRVVYTLIMPGQITVYHDREITPEERAKVLTLEETIAKKKAELAELEASRFLEV